MKNHIKFVLFCVAGTLTTLLAQPASAADAQLSFEMLGPGQQRQVEDIYKNAEIALSEQKYDIAINDIHNLKKILPKGYKDSAQIEFNAEQANLTMVQKQRDDEAIKAYQKKQKMIDETITACEKNMSKFKTDTELLTCLKPVAEADPGNAQYLRLWKMFQLKK